MTGFQSMSKPQKVSKALKQLARDLDIPVIAASQLRRDAEGKEASFPTSPIQPSLSVMLMLLWQSTIYQALTERLRLGRIASFAS